MPRKDQYAKIKARMDVDPQFAEKRRAEDREGHKQRMENHPERTKAVLRKKSLKKWGWTPEMYDEAFNAQNGRCAICGEAPKPRTQSPTARLDADHMHTNPPVPRGLLCTFCNTAIGLLKESPELLVAAAAYINKYAQSNATKI
jgi:hypothetical protein